MKRVGIIGGTFDPVHYGHLILAEQAREEAALDQIVFMPAMVQPFKLNAKSAGANHRYAMLVQAVSGNPYFSVSRRELDRSRISYTIYTLRDCKAELEEDAELYFIIGTDAFLGMEKWHASEELLTGFSFIIGTRPGYKEQELKRMIEHVREKYGTKIIEINNSEVEISSTDIKDRIHKGKSIKYLVPEGVEVYINENRLYRE